MEGIFNLYKEQKATLNIILTPILEIITKSHLQFKIHIMQIV